MVEGNVKTVDKDQGPDRFCMARDYEELVIFFWRHYSDTIWFCLYFRKTYCWCNEGNGMRVGGMKEAISGKKNNKKNVGIN